MGSCGRLRLGLLVLAVGLCAFAPAANAAESEQDVRDRIESQFRIKAAVAKGGDNAKLCIDLFDALKKANTNPVECRVLLEGIILLSVQDENSLETARIAAGMWVQLYKLPPIDVYEFYLNNLKTLRDKGRCDKDTLGIEMFFTRNDEIKLYVQADDYTHAVKVANDNKAFADTLNDRDIKNFAYDVQNNLLRREKLQKRKDEMLAQLSPDPDAPAANAAVASFLLLEAATRSEATPYLLKSADPMMTAYAELRQAHANKVELGCRDFLRLGEMAYQLSKKAVSDEAKEDLLNESNEAFDIAQKSPEADKLFDQNNIALPLAIQRGYLAKVAVDLQMLKRKSIARADNLVYLFTHVSFFADPRNPLGNDWSFKKDQNNEWSADGSAITFIKGDGKLTCNAKLQDDFTLSFDLLPMVEVQDKNSTVFFGVYFNNGMKAGLQNNSKEAAPHFQFDFGKSSVTPVMGGFTGWTRWEIHQKGGVINIVINGRALLTNTNKATNAIAGTFAFGCEPASPFKLRNIRVRSDN